MLGYTVRTVKNYRHEIARRQECVQGNYTYFPKLTLGVVVGRAFCAAMPGVNLVALVFSVAGPMLQDIFRFFGALLDIPLVRPHQKK